MNITMLHDLDTGFLASTLKPAFEALGHTCTVIQTVITYLEEPATHIDHLLSTMKDDDIAALTAIYKETDLFIIRSVTDFTLRACGVLPYITRENTIFRVHGSDLREKNIPYSMRTWKIDWHGKEPLLVGPRDSSLMPLYRTHTLTHIERPCNFPIFPRKRIKDIYALHTPTNLLRKGTQELLDTFSKEGTIQLHILSGIPRTEALRLKAGASFFIDFLGTYPNSPYGMNSVEAWFYKIPVFSTYHPIDEVLVPELPTLVHNLDITTLQREITHYEPDRKALTYAYKYAITTHDPSRIAHQYIALCKALPSMF